MDSWNKLIFVSENGCEYRNVLGNVDIWRVPILAKVSHDGLGTSKIETYHRRTVTLNNIQLDVFSFEGLSEDEILKSIQQFTTQLRKQ